MKLHLTKGLLVALMAAAAQTMAAELYVNQTGTGAGASGKWSIGSGFDASSADRTASAAFANGDSLTVNAAVGLTMQQETQLANLTVNSLFNLNSTSYTLTVTGDLVVNAAFNVKSDLTLGTSVATGESGSINVSSGVTLDLSSLLDETDLTISSTGADSYSDGSNGIRISGVAYSASGLLDTASLSLSSGSFVAVDGVTYMVGDSGTMNAADDTTTYYVNEGTVSASSLGVATNVQVAAGATLEFASSKDSNTYAIKLAGDDTSVATMALGGTYQCTEGTITLAGNATITGSNEWGIIGNGGDIIVEGTNNTISSVLSIRKVDQNIEVEENGELTINSVNYNPHGNKHAEGDEVAELNKTGKGTLILAAGATVNSNVVLNVEEGTFDLSHISTLSSKELNLADGATLKLGAQTVSYSGDMLIDGDVTGTGDIELEKGTLTFTSNATVTDALGITITDGTLDLKDTQTLTLESLDLAAGTTIVLGENTRITVTDALTIGSGVIFDVSSWCDYDSFSPYELITYTGTGDFNPILPEYVTIKTSTGDNEKAYLTVSGNSVTLVPEPTTATLSLLALAGLAARRRRK